MDNSRKTLAIIIEGVAGWLGFLGIGHFIMGNWIVGLILLLGWWGAIIVFLGVALGTLGGGLLCIVPVWFVVPILSAIALAVIPQKPKIYNLPR